jgi:hypothetical protein
MERRRYLDQPFLDVLLDVERILELLRPLTRHSTNALPQRLRTRLSVAFMRASSVRRELIHRPEALLEERRREDERER